MPYRISAALAALALLAACTRTAGPSSPRLIVLIVVDQMRTDFIELLRPHWTAGFARLLDEGAWFPNAAYPYLNTYTCPGHATIGTGALPLTHGIVDNSWYERDTARTVACAEDETVRPVPYDGRGSDIGNSAHRLGAPTLAGVLRRERGARVVSVALKARSAIMLVGPEGDAVTWLDGELSGWETSTAYADAPVPEVKEFLEANPIDADVGKSWTRRLPEHAYAGPDQGAGESAPRGWTSVFPHGLDGEPGGTFRSQWERSPFADAFVGRFAASMVDAFELGAGPHTDVLAVGFSSPDLVGHMFGPRSHEVQDILLQLDLTLGHLFDHLDARLGRDGYVVALSSDHGVADLPEQLQAEGGADRRLAPVVISRIAEDASRRVAGDGQYVARVNGNDVYFFPGMFEKLSAVSGGVDAVVSALVGIQGIGSAYHQGQLTSLPPNADEALSEAARSYVAERSGQIIVQPDAGFWVMPSSRVATTHGTGNLYDQQVPVILLGPGIRAGRYENAATPADIAPTLAAIAGTALPQADGRVLTEALTAEPSR